MSKSKIEIEWLDDDYDCETCGFSYATGAIVRVEGTEVIKLEPVAHCFGSMSWSVDEVYKEILDYLGYDVHET